MSKYGSLSRIVKSHVQEEQEAGGSGNGPLWFFLIALVLFIAALAASVH